MLVTSGAQTRLQQVVEHLSSGTLLTGVDVAVRIRREGCRRMA